MKQTFAQYLIPVLRMIIRYPYRVMGICLVSAILAFLAALQLRIDNDISKLIPEHYPSVQALEDLRSQVGSENEVAVAVSSPSFQANLSFAETLAVAAMELQAPQGDSALFTRYQLRKETAFMKDNALYFATDDELSRLRNYLHEEIEKAKEEANPFFFDLEEEMAEEEDSIAEELSDLYNELAGSEYMLSEDSTTLVIRFFANGSQTDLDYVRGLYKKLEEEISSLSPADFHPAMEVTSGGRFIRTLIEVETISRDVTRSFGSGVLMLMSVIVIYFFIKSYRLSAGKHFNGRLILSELIRIPSIVLIIGIPLVISLAWTFGLTRLLIGNLNIMTSTLGLLLFGMGLDFGIHLFARYSEERGAGCSPEDAALQVFSTTGEAVLVVGITTSAAFFILMTGDFKGFSEFGLIAGLGILFAILAYLIFLPAMLVVFDKTGFLNLRVYHQPEPEDQISETSGPLLKNYMILFAGLILAVLSAFQIPDLEFEYDFGSLEPDYERYHELNAPIRSAYSDRGKRNPAYIITSHPEEAEQVAAELRKKAAEDTLSPTIDRVEVLQDRYSDDPEWARSRLQAIREIRSLLEDPFLSEHKKDEDLKRLSRAASTGKPIPVGSVPDFIIDPFTSKEGELGTLVIIYPSVGLSDGRNSIQFAEDAGRVELKNGSIYYAASTSIVAADMLKLMIAEAPYMIAYTIGVVIFFKLLILRRPRWVLIALVPLLFSFLWLFGWMDIMNWKLTFYNLVVLPTILGIGDDSGIHMVHRYLEEGKGSINKVLRSTGEHITVSAMTTAVGFGGLLFSIHPGMAGIGSLAISGLVLTLLSALIFLPALVRSLERNKS